MLVAPDELGSTLMTFVSPKKPSRFFTVIYYHHNNFDLRTCHKANLRTLSLSHVMVPVPWVFDDFWKRLPHGSWHRSPEVHAPLSVDQAEDVLVWVRTYFFVHGADEESERKKHLSSIITLEPSSASLDKLEISYARDLKGLHATSISEHLCTLRDGALDQARHMWPQGRVQPTKQTAQPIHHTRCKSGAGEKDQEMINGKKKTCHKCF